MPRATALRPIVPQSGDGLRPSIVYVPSCAERISASSGYVLAEALPGRAVMGSFHVFDSIRPFARAAIRFVAGGAGRWRVREGDPARHHDPDQHRWRRMSRNHARGKRIREAIALKNVRKSQALAAELDVSAAAVSRWQSGGPVSLEKRLRAGGAAGRVPGLASFGPRNHGPASLRCCLAGRTAVCDDAPQAAAIGEDTDHQPAGRDPGKRVAPLPGGGWFIRSIAVEGA